MAVLEFTAWEKHRLVAADAVVREAKKAFHQDDWFGALARVQSMIEFWMRKIYEFDFNKRNPNSPLNDELYRPFFFGYWLLVEEIRRLGYISADEARRVVEYGRTRNRIIHRLVKDSHSNPDHRAVTADQLAREFEEALELEAFFRERVQKLYLESQQPFATGSTIHVGGLVGRRPAR